MSVSMSNILKNLWLKQMIRDAFPEFFCVSTLNVFAIWPQPRLIRLLDIHSLLHPKPSWSVLQWLKEWCSRWISVCWRPCTGTTPESLCSQLLLPFFMPVWQLIIPCLFPPPGIPRMAPVGWYSLFSQRLLLCQFLELWYVWEFLAASSC